jgi:hypothetical protein
MTTLALGCASVPPLDNPLQVRPGDADEENPVLLAPGLPTPEGYAEVYDRVLDAVDDYFDIKPASRYSGVIETYPRVAPGYEQFWKPSTHDVHERLKATLQSMRHYARIRIVAGDRGGYRVFVEVFKELEIVPTPLGSNSPRALLQDSSGVDRRAEVIVGPRSAEPQWIPAGPAPHRDYNFEQVILKKIQRSQALR